MGEPSDTVPTSVADAVEIMDAWGRALGYNSSFPVYNKDSFDLWSLGRDGDLGDPGDNFGDDVVNWEKEH